MDGGRIGGEGAARRVGRVLLCGVCCALVYLVVLEITLSVPFLNTYTLVRPADGLGPALGLFFGAPAVVGCTLANGASALAHGMDPGLAALRALANAGYFLVPYLGWRVAMCRSANPAPRFDSTSKVVLYLAVVVLDALYARFVLAPFEPTGTVVAEEPLLVFLNSFDYLSYVGLPTVFVLGHTGLVSAVERARAARALATSGATAASGQAADGCAPGQAADAAGAPLSPERPKRARITLSELVVLLLLLVTMVIIIAFFFIAYGDYLFGGMLTTDDDWGSFFYTALYVIAQFTAVGFALMTLIVYLVVRLVVRPVEALTTTTSHFLARLESRSEGEPLAADQVDERGMHPSSELRTLIDAVNAMCRDLVSYIDRLGAAMAERQRTEAELDIAREIQGSAVPHDFSELRERHQIAVEGFMRPAREVGGDFYDVFEAGPHRVAFVVGDVSGKGVPASLFMMRAQSLIRESVGAHEDVGAALAAANDALCERNDAMLFVTAFVCVLDTETGELTCANAGHNPPSLRRGGVRDYLRMKPGLVLGAMSGVPYRALHLHVSPGDELVLYTDGVTEAADPTSALFGEARLAEALADIDASGGWDRVALTERVVAAVDAFADGAPQADDITILAFRWDVPVREIELPNEDERLEELFAFIEGVVGALGEERTDGHSDGVAPARGDAAAPRGAAGEQAAAAGAAGEQAGGAALVRGADARKLLFRLKLVCEELFVNVCHYAGEPGSVTVRLAAAADAQARLLHLTLRDDGVAYDPLAHEPAPTSPDRPVGGQGIRLVLANAESASYEREGAQNVLRLALRF